MYGILNKGAKIFCISFRKVDKYSMLFNLNPENDIVIYLRSTVPYDFLLLLLLLLLFTTSHQTLPVSKGSKTF